jgi:hypothetical protein
MLHARSYTHATRPGYVAALDAAEQGHWPDVSRRRSGRGTQRVQLLAAALGLLLVLRYTGVLRAARKCACPAPSVLEQQLAAGAHPHPQLAALTDLVVVTGHAVFTGTDFSKAQDADSWYLEEYQQRQGPAVVDSFVEHIRVGVHEAASNPKAVLLFSGGATRESAGPLSEALSYYRVGAGRGFFGDDDAALRERVHTEEYARDSFENLLFSMCRFHELTGTWPRNVTVIGFAFKAERFTSYHRAAIDFPASRFHYIGTAVPNVEEAAAGEREVVHAWARDPYACGAASELAQKRHARDPFARGVPYFGRCAALHGLLTHCGPHPYAGPLPWD